MNLIEISVNVDGEAAEAVSAILSKYGQGGAILEQGGPANVSQPQRIRVKAFLSAQLITALPEIEQALWHLGQLYPIPPPSIRWLSEEDWAQESKSGYTTQCIGHRIVIKPSWLPYTGSLDEIVIGLDPGLAFGTGLHPSTRLCLVALEDYLQPGDRVLDVGTGSGILSIAAAKLGADTVVALDVDDEALRVARENIARNGVETTISLRRASLSPLPTLGSTDSSVQVFNAHGAMDAGFDLLLMNILPKVIATSARAIAACLVPDGLFAVSGIIQSRESFVRGALASADLAVINRRADKDWVALIGRKENRQSDTA